MQDKELEKILQEKADEGKMREFSEVWKDIKDEVVVEKPPKKFNFKRWFPMMLTSAVLVVCLAFTPLIINSFKPAPEEVYYSDELSSQNVLDEEMLSGLSQASITHVDLTRYVLDGCSLLVTEDNIVKGAMVRIYNNPTTFFSEIKIYDKNVDLKLNINKLYDSSSQINSTTVHYKFAQEISGLHEYNVYAVHNDVQYVMQYMGMHDTLIEFLTDFFA